MTGLIIGNLCSLLAMVTDSVSSSRKTAKGVLLVQCMSQIIYGAGAIALKGYSAAVQNVVSMFRNLFAIKGGNNKMVEWTLIALGVVLGIVFNNRGFYGLLPVIANLEYTVAVFKFKDDERALKIAFMICTILFMIFNAVIMNIVGLISNVVVIGSTVIFLIKEKKQN
ncbi:MAG: YgjV family protein [Firmicutes bacterium]|nr:YgjV family protein [Bacillota bacterium]